MARTEKILAMDIGAASIKLSEFEIGDDGVMTLLRFAYREYEEELSDATRMGVISGLLRQMLAEGGFTARRALVCLSGQLSLVRYNRLPIVNTDKKRIRQMAEFEAIQNIPFELSEVIMDYQLIAIDAGEAVDVMSVVIKNDIVEQFTDAIFNVDCEPILIDVSPAAIYNVGRACGIGDEGCDVILNIGGRVSNLVFLEGDKFYSRTIPIAGYSITQQIAKEFGIGFPEAEELKRHHGFVSLGGAYAEPESETAANISRIVRNVMARLHGEINRTINVYRSQQKGSKPSKLYLAGGSSILTYCDTFFSEKLGIPVEYFNPFKCVTLGEEVDRVKLQEVGHMFGEAIGLGLRYAVQCPVELSLIPAKIRRQQQLDSRKPFFIASIVAVICLLAVVWYGLTSRISQYSQLNQKLEKQEAFVKTYITPIEEAQSRTNECKAHLESVADLLKQQANMPAILNEIYRLKPDYVWITSITPIMGDIKPIGGGAAPQAPQGEGDMGGGMFGDPGAEGMEEMGPPPENKGKIGGFEICGSTVKPYKEAVQFTLGPEFPFYFKVEKELPADVSGDQPKMSMNQFLENAMRRAGNTPELVYEAALRNSRIFDSDEKMTGITYDKPSDTIQNFSDFKIQVKLMSNLEVPSYGDAPAAPMGEEPPM